MNEINPQIPAHLMEAASPTVAKKQGMGKEDFMKLLMAQLQHQDPLKPMNHEEFATQLAQFSSLEQLSNIGSGIQSLRSGIGEGSKISALGMIGKTIQAPGNEVDLTEGQALQLKFIGKEGVKPTKVSIFDSAGRPARELDINPKEAAGEFITWDGKLNDGSNAPGGKYSFRISGVGKDGKAQEVGSELKGKVTGVDLEGTSPTLVVETPNGKMKIDLNKVKNVVAEDSKDATNSKPVEPKKIAIDKTLTKPVEVVARDEDSDATEAPTTKDVRPLVATEPSDDSNDEIPSEWRSIPSLASNFGGIR